MKKPAEFEPLLERQRKRCLQDTGADCWRKGKRCLQDTDAGWGVSAAFRTRERTAGGRASAARRMPKWALGRIGGERW